MRWGSVGPSCVLGLASLIAAGPAHAQDRGRLQLSLQSTLLRYERLKSSPEDSAVGPFERSFLQAGLGADSGLGAGIGYLWTDVLLGARTSFSTYHQGIEPRDTLLDASSDGAQLNVTPRVELLLARGGVRPFIAGHVGYRYTWGSGESTSSAGGTSMHYVNSSSAHGFTIGASGGVHAFLNHWLSIDPELTLLASTAKVENRSNTPQYDQNGYIGNADNTQRSTDTSLALMLTLSLSAWLGGH